MLQFGVWSLWQKMWFISPRTHPFFFFKYACSFQQMWIFQAKQERSTPTQPPTAWRGYVPPYRGACQAQQLRRTAFHPPPKENNFFYINKYIYIKNPYISCWDVSSEETKVWRLEQRAWASVRPLSSYSEGTESLPFAAKLCSVIHSLVLQRECFKVYNRAGKKKPHKNLIWKMSGIRCSNTRSYLHTSVVSYINFNKRELDMSMMTDSSKT